MSVLAQGNATFRGVEEDILVPLLARLTAISALLDSAAPQPADPATREGGSLVRHIVDNRLRAEARMMLEKVRREMVQLEDVFRRVDNAEKRIRYCFDPVERHLDEALQQEPPDTESIHAGLLAIDAGIAAVKATIHETYNLRCNDNCGGQDECLAIRPTQALGVGAGTVTANKKMAEIHRAAQMNHLRLAVGSLEPRLRGCLLCLASFPDGAVIKKRLLIHWWLAEDFIQAPGQGKKHFDDLVAKGFIVPCPTALCDTVHRCTVRPWMRDLLTSVAKRNAFLELNAGDYAFARRACLIAAGGKTMQSGGFSEAVRAIYNIGQKYVEINERWFANKKKELRVLQLGQWREFRANEQINNPMDSHIELSGVERLRDMASSCKNLRYISFRGISGIESLPDSIGKLRQLLVLDLRACHNLEELGQGITNLDRLECLDLSECHLLIGVPKGLGQLTRLEILKGFVIANSNSKDFCHLNELVKLDKLRKLGIVIGKMAVPTEDEFMKLGEFKALKSLKIIWAVLTSAKNNGNTQTSPSMNMKFALPPNLTKLDLHCFPFADFADWIRPTQVEKLYIRGGKLMTLGDEEEWKVEVLRLRFLSDLHCDHGRLRRSFRKLKAEKIEIHQCPHFSPTGNDVEESVESHTETEEIA